MKGTGTPRKREPVDPKAWELAPDYVWIELDGCLAPSAFFLKWWQAVAEAEYGDKNRWLDVAYGLGYVLKTTEPNGKEYWEANGFEHDPALARKSLHIPRGHPLIFQNACEEVRYKELWDWMLGVS